MLSRGLPVLPHNGHSSLLLVEACGGNRRGWLASRLGWRGVMFSAVGEMGRAATETVEPSNR